jgi:hypothetical protein
MEQQQQAFFCQSCRARLVLVRGESDGGDKKPPESWAALNASIFESGKTYESFIVLDDRRPGERHLCCASISILCNLQHQSSPLRLHMTLFCNSTC